MSRSKQGALTLAAVGSSASPTPEQFLGQLPAPSWWRWSPEGWEGSGASAAAACNPRPYKTQREGMGVSPQEREQRAQESSSLPPHPAAPDGPFPSCLVQVGKPFRCLEGRGFMVLWVLALLFLHRFDLCYVRLL